MKQNNDPWMMYYKSLGCAVIQQAVEDYWDDLITSNDLFLFLHNTLWVQCLDLDIDSLYERAVEKWGKLHGETEE